MKSTVLTPKNLGRMASGLSDEAMRRSLMDSAYDHETQTRQFGAAREPGLTSDTFYDKESRDFG